MDDSDFTFLQKRSNTQISRWATSFSDDKRNPGKLQSIPHLGRHFNKHKVEQIDPRAKTLRDKTCTGRRFKGESLGAAYVRTNWRDNKRSSFNWANTTKTRGGASEQRPLRAAGPDGDEQLENCKQFGSKYNIIQTEL